MAQHSHRKCSPSTWIDVAATNEPQTLQQYSGTMRTYAGPRGENRNRNLIIMRTLGHAVKNEIDFVLILRSSFQFDFDFDLF